MTTRLGYIDVLRAIAVISVFCLHVRQYWVPEDAVTTHGVTFVLDRILAQGAAGVDIFIVLSGFCLTYPLVRRCSTGLAAIDIQRFYRRRATRILPAYYVALALVIGLELIPPLQRRLVARPLELGDVVTHLLLVQPFWGHTAGAINGPLWSIALEVQLYLLFPALLFVLRRQGWLVLLGSTLVLALVWDVTGSWWLEAHPDTGVGQLSHLIPAHLFQFVLGMLAADMVCRPRRAQVRRLLPLVLLGVALGGFGTIVGDSFMRTVGYGLAAFALTVVGAAVPSRRFQRRWSPMRLAMRLGVVSYSFYLLHQPFLLLIAPLVRSLGLSPLETYLFAVLSLLAMAAIAQAFFNCVERPFLMSGGMRDAIVQPPQDTAVRRGDEARNPMTSPPAPAQTHAASAPFAAR